MAVVSLGLGWVVAGRLLRPVHELTGLARRLSESTLHERIRLQRPRDELKELADTFDAMLERLDKAFAGQRQFVANASHELRTPLTIIRTELDVALADPDLPREELEATAAAMRDALARSEEVIDGLLVLARSDALTETEAVDLAGLVRESLERHAAEADAAGLGAELALEPSVVEGDRRLLGRMVDNLVENAMRHNEQGGWLRAETGGDSGESDRRADRTAAPWCQTPTPRGSSSDSSAPMPRAAGVPAAPASGCRSCWPSPRRTAARRRPRRCRAVGWRCV